MSVIIENISKSYGNQKALDSVSFQLQTGELTGFLGPNGAGKSTLMKIITGYLAADSGTITMNGQAISAEDHQLKAQIGYLPEHNPLYPDLYIREYLDLTASLYKLPQRKARVEEAIEMTGLGLEQKKKIGALSKGYRQRVGLAQALIHNPSVLILDEPTTGLDPNQLEEIRSLIRRVSAEKTVLFSTHIMQEVEAICSRVIVINRGKLIADSPVDEFKNRKLTGSQQLVTVEFDQPVSETLIGQSLPVQHTELKGANTFRISSATSEDLRPLLFDFAVQNKVKILSMSEQQSSLEGIFQELTKESR